ncbi:MAG: type I DNA topoisomerase [Bacteroidales bacterium]|nr:type I DNA topoisomerase [Bacteroidales bacterium]
MQEHLVIVESPAKAKTIGNFLGKDYQIKSSFGHIRDLSKEEFGIDLANNYMPDYIVPDDKKNVVKELRSAAQKATTIWLASDEDREGEAIAWHLMEALELSPDKTRRIVFHEITQEAIQHAIENPREINIDLVNAQQARRILDRIVGFELSPLLWKKIKPALSAGRVQSVAVRLIAEREREINSFSPKSGYKVTGFFQYNDNKGKSYIIQAEYPQKFSAGEEANAFLEQCINVSFSISDLTKKPGQKSPPPPLTTSTLQQEASRRLNFSVAQTMRIAQRLYESGHITYMRTDSVNLSKSALGSAKKVITETFGEDYSKPRNFKTKTKGAQEAHEAIRPTYMQNRTIAGNRQDQRLYELIWKRTVASQMSEAKLERTTINIHAPGISEAFIASGEVITFDGFLKVYIETPEDNQNDMPKGLLPPVQIGDVVDIDKIEAIQRFSQFPPRYTEANLVKKLEELGIGRPSTYAPTISTIQNRGYVVKEDRPGKTREYTSMILQEDKIYSKVKEETYNAEKSKLFPTDIGLLVNDFLVENFKNILDYNFTANVEKEFDKIAEGKMEWTKMIDNFYPPFHVQVDETTKTKRKPTGVRNLGDDPESGKPVYVKVGRYGPMVQIGDPADEEKPRFASLLKHQSIETIQLKEALDLFNLPRSIGKFEDQEITVGIGKYGPYIRHDNKFYSLKAGQDDPFTVELERAVTLINEKREQEQKKVIKQYTEDEKLQVLNGRWGPYISYGSGNFRIPKGNTPEELTHEQCLKIIEESKKKKSKKK